VKDDDAIGEGLTFKSRTVFVIDDKRRFKLIFNYPAVVGLNTAEVLRVVDCLQTAAHAEYVTPSRYTCNFMNKAFINVCFVQCTNASELGSGGEVIVADKYDNEVA
jgi:alkyl hydroperoxide reductase subunit AhpC